MGLAKWIAKKGNVGGTARWAAKGYFALKKVDPTISTREACCRLLEIRYNNNHAKLMEGRATIQRSESFGLSRLVTLILMMEAGFSRNDLDTRAMFIDVIQEELERLGAPTD